jgi:hypothetical protein
MSLYGTDELWCPHCVGGPVVVFIPAVALPDFGVLILAGLIIYCTVLYNGTH